MRLHACTLVSLLIPATALADSITLSQYHLTPTAADGFVLSRPLGLEHLQWSSQFAIDYAHRPLVWEQTTGSGATAARAVVSHQGNAQASLAIGIHKHLLLFAGLSSVVLMRGDRVRDPGLSPAAWKLDSPGPGNARLGTRVHLLRPPGQGFSLALQGTFVVPLAEWMRASSRFAGEDSLAATSELLSEYSFTPRLWTTVNLGVQHRRTSQLLNTRVGSQATGGMGITVQAHREWQLAAELFGRTSLLDAFEKALTPLELLVGGRWQPRFHWRFALAIGTSLLRGVGAAEVRVIATVGYQARARFGPNVHQNAGLHLRDGNP